MLSNAVFPVRLIGPDTIKKTLRSRHLLRGLLLLVVCTVLKAGGPIPRQVYYVISWDGASVHAEPDEESPVLTSVSYGEQVLQKERYDRMDVRRWTLIDTDKGPGWIHENALGSEEPCEAGRIERLNLTEELLEGEWLQVSPFPAHPEALYISHGDPTTLGPTYFFTRRGGNTVRASGWEFSLLGTWQLDEQFLIMDVEEEGFIETRKSVSRYDTRLFSIDGGKWLLLHYFRQSPLHGLYFLKQE